MHGLHARIPKHFVLEERLERYATAIEILPSHLAGQWAEACYPLSCQGLGHFSQVWLDLGCGKGAFTCDLARLYPDVLVVGIDSEPVCIAYAAQKACEAQLHNAVFVGGNASKLSDYFAQGELSRIYLNYPTPFPRKRDALARLTHAEKLMSYREVLAEHGTVIFRTDSQPLFDFSLTQVKAAGYTTLWVTDDVRSQLPDEPPTGYELRLTAQGAHVYGFEIAPGPAPEKIEQTAKMSLVDYLPEDLDHLSYIPHGMEGTVINIRNRRARMRNATAHA